MTLIGTGSEVACRMQTLWPKDASGSGSEPPDPHRHGQNERAMPLGRKAWLFCGSDRGGQRAAILYTLIQTARLNDVDPQAWIAEVLARINDHRANRLAELLPWHWSVPVNSPASL